MSAMKKRKQILCNEKKNLVFICGGERKYRAKNKEQKESSKEEVITLDQTNAIQFSPVMSMIIVSMHWHKFVIHNGATLDRVQVLKAILDKVKMHEIVPVDYKIDGQNSQFIARNCASAIQTLCKCNLIVDSGTGTPLILSIVLCGGTPPDKYLDVKDLIRNIIKKRIIMSGSIKTLNLDALYKDPDVSEKIYLHVCHPQILTLILSLARPYGIRGLQLTNNQITSVKSVEVWSGVKISYLDLRNNLIEDFGSLTTVRMMHITELLLSGNPICENISESDYVKDVREICPSIEKLDNVLLQQHGFPGIKKNYLVNLKGFDFVNQFLEQYFTLYDKPNRWALSGFYHKDAIFSLTYSNLLGEQSPSSIYLDMECYRVKSRNIKLMSDFSKSSEGIYFGPTEILKVICLFPETQHDPYSFTVDVVHYTVDLVVLTVTGVFRDAVNNLTQRVNLYNFARTFVLKPGYDKEYLICNEQLHISNATKMQMQNAFKTVKVHISDIFKSRNFTAQNKEYIVEAISSITTMTPEWSKNILEKSKWDMKEALTTFVELYKDEKIPIDAFKK